ncbi:MAG: nucleotidyltransferase domain-containing protein [Chloroflexi bacterium]|nr:nucleotidyltransferase domain-containing protein [Chloroflexota bacterium]
MTTALDLTPEDLKRYRDAARRRAAPLALAPTEAAVRDELLTRVRRAAAVLTTRYGAKRVTLFGSLAHEAWYAADSDVDLAVEGMPSEDYWRAWRAVEEIIGDRSVDLVEVETARESLRSAIERRGVML